MALRDSDSYIFRKGVTPNTLSVISSKNRIFAVNAKGIQTQLGVVASFDPTEARSVEAVRGIGFGDHIAELVPGVTDPMTISVARTALYTSNIYQVFGYNSGIDGIVRSLRHHRWPFDIRQEILFSTLAASGSETGAVIKGSLTPQGGSVDENAAGANNVLLTIYEACWISDYSVSFAADTALVQESVTISVSDILNSTAYTAYSGVTNEKSFSQLSGPNTMSQRLRPVTQ